MGRKSGTPPKPHAAKPPKSAKPSADGGLLTDATLLQPSVTIKDGQGVEIAADTKDPGTPERHQQGHAFDDGPGKGAIPGRVGQVAKETTVKDRTIARVYKNQEGLDLMLRNETITLEQYNAGRAFQNFYDWSNQYPLRAVNYEGVSGSMSREDFLQKQIKASVKVKEITQFLGGRNSILYVALETLVGKRLTLESLFHATGRPHHFWRGAIVSALTMLESHLFQGRKNNRVSNKSTG